MNRLVKSVLWVAGLGLLVFGVLGLGAYPTGITGRTQKPGSTPGCTCHGLSPTAGVSVALSGPASLAPNQAGSYALEVRGGPLAAAGTDIATSAGSLSPVDGSLQKIGDELTHTGPKSPAGEVVRFDFTYTAPSSEGAATLYANGNSVNLSNSSDGDQWNFASNLTIAVQAATGVASLDLPGSFALDQNYPNPFNPSTTINFTLPTAAHVRLLLYDVSGQLVATIVDETMDAGYKAVQWTAGGLASGVYLYRLDALSLSGTGSFSASRKLIVMK
jgi:hypothetical protein